MDAAAEDSGHLQPPAPSAPASTLPSYPELSIAAIDALNDPNGSINDLPPHSSFSTLTSRPPTPPDSPPQSDEAEGDLVMVNDNYMRPDQNAPPKRGRGRLRKKSKPEDEAFYELCSWFFNFPLHTAPVTPPELKNYRLMGLVMVIPTFQQKLKSLSYQRILTSNENGESRTQSL